MNMAEWLILRLPRAADGAADWLLADGEGRPLAPVQHGLPVASAATGRRVAVLVPGSEVLDTGVDLPQGTGARSQQVVPFALEEQVVADVELQHFAIGRAPEGGLTPVAVVARVLLDEWLGVISAAGLDPELVCADTALMPRVPGHVVALLEGQMLTVRDAAGNVLNVSAPAGSFATALDVALGATAAESQLLLHCTPQDWQLRSTEIEATRRSVATLKVQLLGSGALPWLATQLHSEAPINLLQGSYARRGQFGVGFRRWRIAAALAGALLLLHVGSQAFRLWRLGGTERELDAAIAQLVGPALSAGNGTGSVRARVEKLLLGAQSAGGQAGLLPAMQVLAQAMGAVPGARVEALSFRDGALQLKLRASDAQSLERINQSLRAAGWQSDLVSGAASGDAFEGNIQLRGGVS
jgi:general secretion pathway protein L